VEGAANPVASPPAPEPEPKGNPPDSGQGKAPEAPSEGAPLSFQAFRDRWRAILRAARQQDPRIQGLLNSCKPLGVERDALVIGFRSDLLREKMEKRENLRKAREAIREVMGSEVGIRCVLVGSGGSPRGQYGAAPPMEDDGMVATAVRDLGAEVIEVRSTNPDSTPSAD
jgi:DNA polymerase-3 subunit gamma/tau